LAEVAYYEGGIAALQAHLAATHLEDSPHSGTLLQLAYLKLIAADSTTAKALAERALTAPDYTTQELGDPWNIARWGVSDDLTLALIEMRTGDEAAAARRLDSISTTLDELVRNGEKRFGVDEVRATILANRGNGDAAMQALTRAAGLGWRRSWWAQREPDLAAIWTRPDFRALVSRVDRSNSQLRAAIAPDAH
jgi:hypothetical protein